MQKVLNLYGPRVQNSALRGAYFVRGEYGRSFVNAKRGAIRKPFE